MSRFRRLAQAIARYHSPEAARLRARAVLAMLIGLAAACGSSPSNPTVGEVCAAIGSDFCHQAIVCGLGRPADIPICEASFLANCCVSAALCARESRVDEAYIGDCGAAIAGETCAAVAAGQLPGACYP